MREAFGVASTDWKEGINWADVRDWRLQASPRGDGARRARSPAPLLRREHALRLLDADAGLEPAQAGAALRRPPRREAAHRLRAGRHRASTSRSTTRGSPRRTSATPTSGSRAPSAPPPTSRSTKFVNALVNDLEEAGVSDQPLGVDFIDINLMRAFEERGIELDRRHVPDDGSARHQEPRRDQGVLRSSGRSATTSTTRSPTSSSRA